MKNSQIILSIVAAFLLSTTAYAQNLPAVVEQAEQKGELPKPVLELMVLDGTELEKATEVTVATSASGTYAQGFTYHAICLSTSEEQAERVHDIAIEAASDKYKLGVIAEARYSLAEFKNNGCVADEKTRVSLAADEDIKPEQVDPEGELTVEEEAVEDDERVVDLEPSEFVVGGSVAGGASQSL